MYFRSPKKTSDRCHNLSYPQFIISQQYKLDKQSDKKKNTVKNNLHITAQESSQNWNYVKTESLQVKVMYRRDVDPDEEVFAVAVEPEVVGADVAVRGAHGAAALCPAAAERRAGARTHRGGWLARAVPGYTLRHRHTQVPGQSKD